MLARMKSMQAIEADLCRPDAPFAIGEGVVLGEPMPVFTTRAPSLRAMLERSAAFGDAEYLVAGERRISYREHLALVGSIARGLRERFGVRKGDRVAILAANRPEWIATFWATVSLGAIAVGMNGWWARDEILDGLDDADPKVLVGDRKRLDRIGGAPVRVPMVDMDADFDALARFDPGAPLSTEPIDEDDPASILYTSGTTGRPKGAVATHRNVVALVQLQFFHGARIAAAAGTPAPSTPPSLLSGNPLFHVSGSYSGAVAHLAAGAKSVWLVGRFDPEQVLALIERERVTGWAPMGSMAWRVLRHPDLERYDRGSLRSVGCGGAPVTREIQSRLREAFPNVRPALTVGYGLTEGTALATMNFGEELVAHPTSVGRPMPTVAIAIRDPDGRDLADGEEGEIAIRSPLVMREYFRNPEATRACIGPGRWLRTGDVGTMHEGRLYVATRKRDLILRGAENVYPIEIESRLAAHPRIREAAVIGVESEEYGQQVKAVVVADDGAPLDFSALARWVAETLAYYKVPSQWEQRAELPRNASGKVMKYLLAESRETPFVEE
jgi:long-chain acyl-CoA synthetase